jgi:hypothetical protein
MQNFWNNNSFDFMMLLLKYHLWLDEGCYCVCVCVCERWEVLGVDCKLRGGSFRCSLEAGDEEAVLGGDGGTRFQYYQTNKTKKNNTISWDYTN